MEATKKRRVVTAVFAVEHLDDDAEPLTLLLTDLSEMSPTRLVSLTVEDAPAVKLDLGGLQRTGGPLAIGQPININGGAS